jgi:hypothetical protein
MLATVRPRSGESRPTRFSVARAPPIVISTRVQIENCDVVGLMVVNRLAMAERDGDT